MKAGDDSSLGNGGELHQIAGGKHGVLTQDAMKFPDVVHAVKVEPDRGFPQAKQLVLEAAAMDFVRDAYGHLRAIAAHAGAQALLQRAGIARDAGVVDATDLKGFIETAKTRQRDREAKVRTLA